MREGARAIGTTVVLSGCEEMSRAAAPGSTTVAREGALNKLSPALGGCELIRFSRGRGMSAANKGRWDLATFRVPRTSVITRKRGCMRENARDVSDRAAQSES